MKKIIFSILVIFAFSSIQAQSTNARPEVAPKINSFIHKYFPGKSIVKYKYKMEVNKKVSEYKIYLDDFTKLKFNTKFEVIEIEGDSRLPDSVIPSKIASYVKAKYPDLFIVEWERKANKQEVELNNDLELEFDLDGNFLRIDD